MTMSETKNKGGRPRKHPVGARVPTLAFRVRDGLREKLDASAAAGQRSISEEIERRLEQSFVAEETNARLDRIEKALEALKPKMPEYQYGPYGGKVGVNLNWQKSFADGSHAMGYGLNWQD